MIMESEQVKKRRLIISEYLNNPPMSQRQLAKLLKLPKSTVQNALLKFKNELSVQRKRGSGRKRGSADPELQKRVVKEFKRKPNMSVRDMARKMGTSKSTIHTMKTRAGLRSKVEKVPASRTLTKTTTTTSKTASNAKKPVELVRSVNKSKVEVIKKPLLATESKIIKEITNTEQLKEVLPVIENNVCDNSQLENSNAIPTTD